MKRGKSKAFWKFLHKLLISLNNMLTPWKTTQLIPNCGNQKYWGVLEKFIKYIPRAKTVLVYWYWIPKPTTTFPASLGITPNWSPTWKQNRSLSQFAVCCHYGTLLLFLHWTTSLSSWWPARSTPPSSNSAASSLGGRYTYSLWKCLKSIPLSRICRLKFTLLEGKMTSAVTTSLLPSSAATMLGCNKKVD